MADQKISELTNITGANLANADEFVVVDISADQTKAVTRAEFFKNTPPIDVNGTVTATGNISVERTAGYGAVEIGGPSGGFIDLKAPFSDDYDARIIYNAGSDLQIVTLADEPILLRQGSATKLNTTSTGVNVTGTVTADGLTVDGNVLVGTISSAAVLTLQANSVTAVSSLRVFANGNSACTFRNAANSAVGSIAVNASSTAYNTSSDYRLKENITPVQGAADIVKAMRPVTYNFKEDLTDWHDGFLAHELQELHPRAVTGEKDAVKDEEYEVTPAVEATFDAEGVELTPAVPAVMGTRSVPDYQGVDYSKLTPILTAALQEALNKIDALEARLAAANI